MLDLTFQGVGYAAGDPERTRRWLREVLEGGDEVALETATGAGAYTTANNDVGAFHICLRTADIAVADARLRAHGVRPSSAPTRSEVGPVLLYFRDPDGVQYQLIELPGAEDAPARPQLHHVAVTVADLEAAVEWLTDTLGAGPPMRSSASGEGVSQMLEIPGAAYDVALLPVGGLLLELMAFRVPAGRDAPPAPGGVGCMRLAFTAKDPPGARERLAQGPPSPPGLNLYVV